MHFKLMWVVPQHGIRRKCSLSSFILLLIIFFLTLDQKSDSIVSIKLFIIFFLASEKVAY